MHARILPGEARIHGQAVEIIERHLAVIGIIGAQFLYRFDPGRIRFEQGHHVGIVLSHLRQRAGIFAIILQYIHTVEPYSAVFVRSGSRQHFFGIQRGIRQYATKQQARRDDHKPQHEPICRSRPVFPGSV